MQITSSIFSFFTRSVSFLLVFFYNRSLSFLLISSFLQETVFSPRLVFSLFLLFLKEFVLLLYFFYSTQHQSILIIDNNLYRYSTNKNQYYTVKVTTVANIKLKLHTVTQLNCYTLQLQLLLLTHNLAIQTHSETALIQNATIHAFHNRRLCMTQLSMHFTTFYACHATHAMPCHATSIEISLWAADNSLWSRRSLYP